jgi:hypothetical protein
LGTASNAFELPIPKPAARIGNEMIRTVTTDSRQGFSAEEVIVVLGFSPRAGRSAR